MQDKQILETFKSRAVWVPFFECLVFRRLLAIYQSSFQMFFFVKWLPFQNDTQKAIIGILTELFEYRTSPVFGYPFLCWYS